MPYINLPLHITTSKKYPFGYGATHAKSSCLLANFYSLLAQHYTPFKHYVGPFKYFHVMPPARKLDILRKYYVYNEEISKYISPRIFDVPKVEHYYSHSKYSERSATHFVDRANNNHHLVLQSYNEEITPDMVILTCLDLVKNGASIEIQLPSLLQKITGMYHLQFPAAIVLDNVDDHKMFVAFCTPRSWLTRDKRLCFIAEMNIYRNADGSKYYVHQVFFDKKESQAMYDLYHSKFKQHEISLPDVETSCVAIHSVVEESRLGMQLTQSFIFKPSIYKHFRMSRQFVSLLPVFHDFLLKRLDSTSIKLFNRHRYDQPIGYLEKLPIYDDENHTLRAATTNE